jgi:hypothetical protein
MMFAVLRLSTQSSRRFHRSFGLSCSARSIGQAEARAGHDSPSLCLMCSARRGKHHHGLCREMQTAGNPQNHFLAMSAYTSWVSASRLCMEQRGCPRNGVELANGMSGVELWEVSHRPDFFPSVQRSCKSPRS